MTHGPYDPVDLEVRIADTREMLLGLDEFERFWAGFADILRQIVMACAGEETIYGNPEVELLIAKADKVREQLRPLRARALASYTSASLSALLETSIRADEQGRLQPLLTEHRVHRLDPIGYETMDVYAVSPKRLDVTLGECTSVFAERRLELDGQLRRLSLTQAAARREEEKERERERARLEAASLGPRPALQQAPEVTLKALVAKWINRIPLPGLRRFLWSAFIDHLKRSIGFVLVALVLGVIYHFFPNIVHVARDLWSRLPVDTTRVGPH